MKKFLLISSMAGFLTLSNLLTAQNISKDFAPAPDLKGSFAQDNPAVISSAHRVVKHAPELRNSLPSVTACDSLDTFFTGGNGQAGIMFDVVAINNVKITYFGGNLDPQASVIEIYYKAGSYMGSETNSSAWTLIGSTTVYSSGAGASTFIDLPINVSIAAGQTSAFYLTGNVNVTGAGYSIFHYTNGAAQGSSTASNLDLQILEGVGKEYPFLNTFPTAGPPESRIFNGTVHYCDPSNAGISEYDNTTAFVISPNPVHETATITITNRGIHNGSSVALKIYDLLGNEVMSIAQTYSAQGKSVAEFNKGNLQSGMYLLRFTDENGAIHGGKLIVE